MKQQQPYDFNSLTPRHPPCYTWGRMRETKLQILSLSLIATMAMPQAFAAPRIATGASNRPQNNAPLNQRDIQILSRQVNDRGADESLKNSAVYAMQALMDLNATRLPAAMKNGYQAYGKFRTSENLDRMKDINAMNASSLASIGSEPIAIPKRTVTSFRRLDPSFLTQGEAGKVAAEFERQSGMKRSDFLTHLAEASEKKISRHDPQMIDKAFGRLEHFIDKIPNKEFRANLEKNLHVVPETMRRGIVAQAVSKLAGFFADAGTANALNVAIAEAEKAPAPVAASAAVAAPVAQDERKPAAPAAVTALGDLGQRKPLTASEKKLKDGKNALAGVVLSAIQVQGQEPAEVAAEEPQPELQAAPGESLEPTIFQQVSKKYRALTPEISPPQL